MRHSLGETPSLSIYPAAWGLICFAYGVQSKKTPLHLLMSSVSHRDTEGEELRRRIALELLDAGASVNAADTVRSSTLN
jgi:hypothetical protein